ncbi:MAG: arginase family protein, partial [Hyphococcus sp.]
MTRPVQLIGLPTDINSSHLRGPAKAPDAIRRVLHNGMSNTVSESGVDVGDESVMKDAGNIDLQENKDDFERIAAVSQRAFDAGGALFLGGDHFVTWPIVEGFARAHGTAPHIVHIDAHPDLYPDFEGNPASHASPFARLFEAGHIRSLTQIGIRTINHVQR